MMERRLLPHSRQVVEKQVTDDVYLLIPPKALNTSYVPGDKLGAGDAEVKMKVCVLKKVTG